ncbi:MAG: dihydroorotase, partial [Casimicrobiaceae bacterium]
MPAATLDLTRPDDWHVHLRDGATLAAVAGATARDFARAIVMPNLRPPVVTTALAAAYRERIRSALPRGSRFEPLMTLYLTEATAAAEIRRAVDSGFVHAVKYYPAGATTHSEAGVRAPARAHRALASMERHGLVLAVHGEATDPEVDVFDRERVFVDRDLAAIV